MDHLTDSVDLRHQLELLREQHRELDESIARLTLSPPEDQLLVRRLKKHKLALKDNIVALEHQIEPDDYA